MKLIRFKDEFFPNWEEKHKHDYRWIKNKEERELWIREHWEIKEDAKKGVKE